MCTEIHAGQRRRTQVQDHVVKVVSALCLAASCWVVSGCALPRIGQVVRSEDKFKGSTTELVRVGHYVQLMRTHAPPQSPDYGFFVDVVHSGGRAMFADELVFLIDGDQMKLEGGSRLDDVNYFGGGSLLYTELAAFPVSEDQIRQVAEGRSVEARLYGAWAGPPFQWDAQRKDAVMKFYELFVLRDWDRLSPEAQEAELSGKSADSGS